MRLADYDKNVAASIWFVGQIGFDIGSEAVEGVCVLGLSPWIMTASQLASSRRRADYLAVAWHFPLGTHPWQASLEEIDLSTPNVGESVSFDFSWHTRANLT